MTLNFDCTHNTAEKTMTCTWFEGRVDLIEFFKENTTAVKMNGELKCTFYNLTVREFTRLQELCQQIANRMEAKKAV